MSAALGLDPLLAGLREAGLPVGVAEVARLQRVFALGPRLEEDRRLKAILRAVLVKSPEDRVRFEPVFDAWLGRAGQEVSQPKVSAAEPEGSETPQRTSQRQQYFWLILASLVLISVNLGLNDYLRRTPSATPASAPTPAQMQPAQTQPAQTQPAQTQPAQTQPAQTQPAQMQPAQMQSAQMQPAQTQPAQTQPAAILIAPIRDRNPTEVRNLTFTAWVPTLTVQPAELVWRGWPAFTLGSLAFLVVVALWLNLRHESWRPEPAPETVRKGPPRSFLTPPTLSGPQLLESREQETLVWGIGHFVAEEPTRRLDLPAAVRETAKAGGITHLLFHQACYAREVWLWIDEAADDPAISRICDEIEVALQAHRLPVERALFRGVPDWLVNSAGQAFAPNEVDERRNAAIVAILTDGRVFARQYEADDRRVRLDALLRSLSHWPRLAFVDFAAEPGNLAAVLVKHSLERIAPPDLAAFLGSNETAKRKAKSLVSGDAAWAAACAIAPASVDELSAFQLRRRLGLATSPWALRDLRTEAPGPPGRLQWQPQDRARRVNWLFAAEVQVEDSVEPGSLLGKALDFWEEVYERELKDRGADSSDKSRLETLAYQHLAMEYALLGLWKDPLNGVRELYRLHSGTLRDLIETHLRDLAPVDWGGPNLLHLPWSWERLPGPERVMLQQMGLGGGMPAARLLRPGRLWLGLGLCLGLAVGALGVAAVRGWRQPEGPPIIVHDPEKSADAWQETRFISAGRWKVAVATRKSQAVQEVPAGMQVAIRWKRQELPCVFSATPDTEAWNCGTLENPPRLPEALWRRVVILATPPGSPEASALAVDLLDSGSADQVIVTSDWKGYARAASGETPLSTGFLVLPNSDWGTLRKALRFDGVKTVHQVWSGLKLLAGDPSAQLRGLPACRNGELLEEEDMTFVHICPGSFTMGSAADDPQAYSDEKPAKEVTLSEFWIGRTEITNAQYRVDQPEHAGPDTLPATNVTWEQAKTFCERHRSRLPTEAEWEYAARAGTQTPWSFGADDSQIEEFAWFGENSGSNPHPVATKKPNPWGLYDMHGNVWEWVEDWYGPYAPDPQTDPKGPEAGLRRSLRGGSFVYLPEFLRSSAREGVHADRGRGIGFRCARALAANLER